MNTSVDCIPCFVRQTLDAARMSSADPAVHEKLIRDVLRWLSKMDMSLSPPALAQRIHRRLRELTGVDDPYRAQKDQHGFTAACANSPGWMIRIGRKKISTIKWRCTCCPDCAHRLKIQMIR